ncbi:MerR family transcriptional regulator [Streptococcus pluranimalium]|uniref:MerR family transcriptional regulator n=1 Tax=Streptococcus pluranimalium TaxID=82348 RepID=UPI0039EA0A62
MKTIKEVSKMAGISVRTLQYYDKISLLNPTSYSSAGYRLYSDKDLEKLQHILLFRALEFPLKSIKEIINKQHFDRQKALEQQIKLLTLKKEHLETLITFAESIKEMEINNMDFTAFDTKKIEEYTQKAKAFWGQTDEFNEFTEKQENRSINDTNIVNQQLMMIFAEFGEIKTDNYDSKEAQILVKKLQNFITNHFYHCSDDILLSLGKMYINDSEFTQNIDAFAGEGTALLVNKAIECYCQ